MSEIKVGDIVGRKSYGMDLYFKVMEIYPGTDGKTYALLKGIDLRLYATAPLDDLQRLDSSAIAAYWHNVMTKNSEQLKRVFQRRQLDLTRSMGRATGQINQFQSFDKPGSVLHVDGDKDYLDICMTTYKQLGIPAFGYHIKENEQSEQIMELLKKHRPDGLVVTGHDGIVKGAENFSDLNNYHNSRHYIDSVNIARQYEKSLDDLVIFAGACQSHYEGILDAGANFASSPQRVLIHAYDPVFVMEKISYTSIYEPVPLKEVITNTITGFDGIGGVETRGKYRLGLPKSSY